MIGFNAIIGFLQVHAYISYITLFLGSYFETLIGPGFFIQGEIFFLAGAILAGLGFLNIWLVYLVCVFGGLAGDHSSYYLGKHYGKFIINKLFKPANKYLNPARLKTSKKFFKTFGAQSAFYARLLGPVSWVTPFLSGIFKVPYKKFAKYNLLGVVVGIGNFMALGYLLGFAYLSILQAIKQYYLITILLIITIIIILNYLGKKFNIIKCWKQFILRQFKKYGIILAIAYIIIYISILYLIFSFNPQR